jgi:hypothetical protein
MLVLSFVGKSRLLIFFLPIQMPIDQTSTPTAETSIKCAPPNFELLSPFPSFSLHYTLMDINKLFDVKDKVVLVTGGGRG